jgi:GNAT superfamily N-acetyltransferase
LGKEDRSQFGCGNPELDRYFHTQIGQDVKRQLATAFIAWHNTSRAIAGYYTLSAATVPFSDLDEEWRKKLPQYPSMPAVLVGRLAVDQNFQGHGLGPMLLADAAARTITSDIGAHFLIVDAIDDVAGRFYHHLGFRYIPDDPRRLFIPLKTLANLL